jgi:4-carboxymuconolactone decarboxylase
VVTEGVGALVVLSAALTVADPEVLGAALDRAGALADPVQVEEVLVQSYLFLGYPAALNALALWRARSGRSAPASSSPAD